MDVEDVTSIILHSLYGSPKVRGKQCSEKEHQEASNAANSIHSSLIVNSSITENDKIVIRKTGKFGHVTEINPFMPDGFIRVATEGSQGVIYSWHKPEELVKNNVNKNSLTRQQIASTEANELLPKSAVFDLLNEETDFSTQNPQAVQHLSKEESVVVREELMGIAAKWMKGYPATEVSHHRITRYLSEEFRRSYDGLKVKDRKNVKNALANILNYIDFNF